MRAGGTPASSARAAFCGRGASWRHSGFGCSGCFLWQGCVLAALRLRLCVLSALRRTRLRSRQPAQPKPTQPPDRTPATKSSPSIRNLRSRQTAPLPQKAARASETYAAASPHTLPQKAVCSTKSLQSRANPALGESPLPVCAHSCPCCRQPEPP